MHEFLNRKEPFIIDGGLSNVLEDMGCNLHHKLWTAHLLEHNPDAIVQAHLLYIQSGAQCITTASYQASFPGLIDMGYSQIEAERLLLKSIYLAEEAIQSALDKRIIQDKPLIAASIGPYGAYLADGSEYRGDYGVTDKVLKDFHSDRIRLFDHSSADILACETIPSYQEAAVLSVLLEDVDTPFWMSFSCKDVAHLNDGTKIEDAVALFVNHTGLVAIGVNCTNPNYISGIIQCIKACVGEHKIIVYPNSGEVYHAKSKTWHGLSEPQIFVEQTKEWIELGASIIGGCCRIGPTHIKQLSELM
ncbi:MAG: homocysteine S-methyltransferase [Saprospiraceae bacterium]|nr:homocysteine S-methyltransferase [Saprospiraceae bacterium]